MAAHQRGADATALGRLLIQAPGAVVSLALVVTISEALFNWLVVWLIALSWLASGALFFHRPAELALSRTLLRLRPPSDEERLRLDPVWREVTARAGIEAHSYDLMVEKSNDLNAFAVAGHVVGVTTYALREVPSSNLAAILAHELGHHTGGHAWSGLLGQWYSLPARLAWKLLRLCAALAIRVASLFSLAGAGVLVLVMGTALVCGLIAMPFVFIPLIVSPYLVAYVARRGELRADAHASALGFRPQLAEVLRYHQAQEASTRAWNEARRIRQRRPGAMARLLSNHPDIDTRLAALEGLARQDL
ncbi:M48 family metalloprotease [Streptomyces sp. TS71-3]|uniref:M48 family metalloprotease n=1 Tax=Streptomyces sp. TS71-3 TaxID=2733862 RepID=UPI001B237167|nr:M48 family metalloprotease [Streptomyces sp. TS71-3]GHJ34931.1 peptidase M48 [Streptomyces sp. TS71-3]